MRRSPAHNPIWAFKFGADGILPSIAIEQFQHRRKCLDASDRIGIEPDLHMANACAGEGTQSVGNFLWAAGYRP